MADQGDRPGSLCICLRLRSISVSRINGWDVNSRNPNGQTNGTNTHGIYTNGAHANGI